MRVAKLVASKIAMVSMTGFVGPSACRATLECAPPPNKGNRAWPTCGPGGVVSADGRAIGEQSRCFVGDEGGGLNRVCCPTWLVPVRQAFCIPSERREVVGCCD